MGRWLRYVSQPYNRKTREWVNSQNFRQCMLAWQFSAHVTPAAWQLSSSTSISVYTSLEENWGSYLRISFTIAPSFARLILLSETWGHSSTKWKGQVRSRGRTAAVTTAKSSANFPSSWILSVLPGQFLFQYIKKTSRGPTQLHASTTSSSDLWCAAPRRPNFPWKHDPAVDHRPRASRTAAAQVPFWFHCLAQHIEMGSMHGYSRNGKRSKKPRPARSAWTFSGKVLVAKDTSDKGAATALALAFVFGLWPVPLKQKNGMQ